MLVLLVKIKVRENWVKYMQDHGADWQDHLLSHIDEVIEGCGKVIGTEPVIVPQIEKTVAPEPYKL